MVKFIICIEFPLCMLLSFWVKLNIMKVNLNTFRYFKELYSYRLQWSVSGAEWPWNVLQPSTNVPNKSFFTFIWSNRSNILEEEWRAESIVKLAELNTSNCRLHRDTCQPKHRENVFIPSNQTFRKRKVMPCLDVSGMNEQLLFRVTLWVWLQR